MTVLQRVKSAVRNFDAETDNIDKIIALAYYIGKEKATKEVSDEYKKLIQGQRNRANNCRYRHLANKVIGAQNYIYFDDYDCGMTEHFGDDVTQI